jgi:chemotaxis protein MotA
LDLGTIIGILFGFGLVAIAISQGGGISWFLDGPSAMIVLGGTVGATLVNYPLKDFIGIFSIAKHVFRRVEYEPNRVIAEFVQMSKVARRDGILSLQQVAEKTRDPFLAKAIFLIIDTPDPGVVTEILETEIDALAERHRKGSDIFTTMGNFAPAMGLLGTLIGLIQMLRKMHDPSTIGPSMAVALITTFYGVILSNLVFIPMAGKLKERSAREIMIKQLILNGVLSLQAGDHPRVIEQKLHSFLAPRERRSSFGNNP